MLFALGNPLRQRLSGSLPTAASRAVTPCVAEDVAKSTMTHHWRVLRDSGVIWQRPQGGRILISLRREDLDARFPASLLDALLKVMQREKQIAHISARSTGGDAAPLSGQPPRKTTHELQSARESQVAAYPPLTGLPDRAAVNL